MLNVYYEEYHNDLMRTHHTRSFAGLEELADWLFGLMRRDYSKDSYAMYWPREEPSRITCRPERGGPTYWVYQIKDDTGRILFSDGTMTAGQKHWSKAVKEWCRACEERRKTPVFDFAE